MNPTIRPTQPDDWNVVRSIFAEGIARHCGTWRDIVFLERRSRVVGPE